MQTDDYGRRLVLDLPFARGLARTIAALEATGFHVVSRIDVRDELLHTIHHDFRRYVLLVACSPQSMLDVLTKDLAAGIGLPVTLAVYELADGETVVVAAEPFEMVLSDRRWRETHPGLVAVAEAETDRLAEALGRLTHREANHPVGVASN